MCDLDSRCLGLQVISFSCFWGSAPQWSLIFSPFLPLLPPHPLPAPFSHVPVPCSQVEVWSQTCASTRVQVCRGTVKRPGGRGDLGAECRGSMVPADGPLRASEMAAVNPAPESTILGFLQRHGGRPAPWPSLSQTQWSTERLMRLL